MPNNPNAVQVVTATHHTHDILISGNGKLPYTPLVEQIGACEPKRRARGLKAGVLETARNPVCLPGGSSLRHVGYTYITYRLIR